MKGAKGRRGWRWVGKRVNNVVSRGVDGGRIDKAIRSWGGEGGVEYVVCQNPIKSMLNNTNVDWRTNALSHCF